MTAARVRQLPLPLSPGMGPTLAGFLPGANAQPLQWVRALAEGAGPERLIYLHGPLGSGRTHLLQGACSEVQGAEVQGGGGTAAYLPLALLRNLGPGVLGGMEGRDLIALDDLDEVAGDPAWEEALFRLFNRVRDAGHGLLVAATLPPAAMTLGLEDLRSRLSWGLVGALTPLDDDLKVEWLQREAVRRSMHLPEPVARYILGHCTRDMAALAGLMNELDRLTLAAQRRLTVPLVRELVRAV